MNLDLSLKPFAFCKWTRLTCKSSNYKLRSNVGVAGLCHLGARNAFLNVAPEAQELDRINKVGFIKTRH